MFFMVILLFSNCATYSNTILLHTYIENVSNDSFKILLKTKDGCSETGFHFKGDYFDETSYGEEKPFVASTLDELNILKDKYFYLPYLDEFSEDYFEKYYLVFIIHHFTGGDILKNERIEKIDGEIVFAIENWREPNISLGMIPKCVFSALYILQISK